MFFKKKKSTKEVRYIQDALFGKMSFIEDDEEGNYYQGNIDFENENIEILIYIDTDIIEEYQKKIFIELQKRYTDMKLLIEGFINKELKKINNNMQYYSIIQDLMISYISIFASQKEEIEIVYDLRDSFCWFEIYFEHFKPNYFGVSA